MSNLDNISLDLDLSSELLNLKLVIMNLILNWRHLV